MKITTEWITLGKRRLRIENGWFGGCRGFDRSEIIAFCELLKNDNIIKSLSLSRYNLCTEEVKLIAAALKVNKNIKRIEAIINEGTWAEGAIAIADALKGHKSITSFDLSYNIIGDKATKALDEMVINNANILFANYNDISTTVTQELYKRRASLETLVESLAKDNEYLGCVIGATQSLWLIQNGKEYYDRVYSAKISYRDFEYKWVSNSCIDLEMCYQSFKICFDCCIPENLKLFELSSSGMMESLFQYENGVPIKLDFPAELVRYMFNQLTLTEQTKYWDK